MVLLATDIAARGLDFARLDWVVQVCWLLGEHVEGEITHLLRLGEHVSRR